LRSAAFAGASRTSQAGLAGPALQPGLAALLSITTTASLSEPTLYARRSGTSGDPPLTRGYPHIAFRGEVFQFCSRKNEQDFKAETPRNRGRYSDGAASQNRRIFDPKKFRM
jgi:hypothetical protein